MMSLEEIGAELGISSSRAGQILKTALRKLSSPKNKEALNEIREIFGILNQKECKRFEVKSAKR